MRQSDWPDFDLEIILIHQQRLNLFLNQLSVLGDWSEDQLYSSISEDSAIDGFEDFVQALRDQKVSPI